MKSAAALLARSASAAAGRGWHRGAGPRDASLRRGVRRPDAWARRSCRGEAACRGGRARRARRLRTHRVRRQRPRPAEREAVGTQGRNSPDALRLAARNGSARTGGGSRARRRPGRWRRGCGSRRDHRTCRGLRRQWRRRTGCSLRCAVAASAARTGRPALRAEADRPAVRRKRGGLARSGARRHRQ